jgi:hypothetical protein
MNTTSFLKLFLFSIQTMTFSVVALGSQFPEARYQEVSQIYFQNVPQTSTQVPYFAKLLSQNEMMNKNFFSGAVIQNSRSKIVHVNSRFFLNIAIEKIKTPILWSPESMMALVPTTKFRNQGNSLIATYQISGFANLFLPSSTMECVFQQRISEQEIPLSVPDSDVYLNEVGTAANPDFVVVQVCKGFNQAFVETSQVLRFYRLGKNQTMMTAKTLMSVDPDFYDTVDFPFVTPWRVVRDNYLAEVYNLKNVLELKLK